MSSLSVGLQNHQRNYCWKTKLTISLHHITLKTLGKLSQFRDGLSVGKTMESLCGNFFVMKDSEITAGLLWFQVL